MSQHQSSHSLGGPWVHVRGTVQHFPVGSQIHQGAYYQHFTMKIDQVHAIHGSDVDLQGQTVFVAVWVGDNEEHLKEIDVIEGEPIRVRGEYIIDAATVYPIDDNTNPILPVIVAESVVYHGQDYGRGSVGRA